MLYSANLLSMEGFPNFISFLLLVQSGFSRPPPPPPRLSSRPRIDSRVCEKSRLLELIPAVIRSSHISYSTRGPSQISLSPELDESSLDPPLWTRPPPQPWLLRVMVHGSCRGRKLEIGVFSKPQ